MTSTSTITILATVLTIRVLADIITYLVKRHAEKEEEKRVKEFEFKSMCNRLDKLEKDICILIQERRETNECE